MKISRNTVATISFTVADEAGKVVGRTQPGQPVEALIGYHFLVPGLEKALDGHEKGDEFTITLTPAESYGEFDPSLVQVIDRRMFGNFEIQVGNVFEADTSHGPSAVVIKKIEGNKVTVDGNHPLAGKTLNFMIVVEDVRDATAEEKAHGHVHHGGHCPGEEGHHHCCHHHDHEHEGETCFHRHEHEPKGEAGGCCCCGHDHEHEGEKESAEQHAPRLGAAAAENADQAQG